MVKSPCNLQREWTVLRLQTFGQVDPVYTAGQFEKSVKPVKRVRVFQFSLVSLW